MDRNKIAGALIGFDEEMTNAEAKIKSVLDELENEKKKVRELSDSLSAAETHCKAFEIEAKEMQVEVSHLESECKWKQEQLDELEKKHIEHEQELVVYQEALKMLQDKVESDESTGARSTSIQEFDSLRDQVSAIKEKDREILSLKEDLVKEKSRLGRLQKLCFNARSDLLRLRDQKKLLEASLQRSIEFIKDLKQKGGTAHGAKHVVSSCDSEGEPKMIDIALDEMRSSALVDLDQNDTPITSDAGLGFNLENFFTFIENQVSFTEKDAADQLITTSNSW
jgi:chromosome segregation ATPase